MGAAEMIAMRNYLSFGGGVNSVAMMLYLLDEGWDFEAVFVNHGGDWPETYEYFDMFQEWLDKQGVKPITVLRPVARTNDGKIFDNIIDYYKYKKLIPIRASRHCTSRFKVEIMEKYFKKPCFCLLGIDVDESKRALPGKAKGIERRWPLIEAEMNRNDCINYIKNTIFLYL